MGEQKTLGKTLPGGNTSPEMTYLPTSCNTLQDRTISYQVLSSRPQDFMPRSETKFDM